MRSVNLSTLKAQLSSYMQHVRAGEEVIVRDRDKAIARIIPCESANYSEQQQRLIARGVLAPARKKRSFDDRLPVPVGQQTPKEVMDQVWREERDGR